MQLLQMRKPVLRLRGLHGSGPIRLALALVTVMMAVTLLQPTRAMSQESLCSLAARHDGKDPERVCGGEPLFTLDRSLDERLQRKCGQGDLEACHRFGLVKLKAQEFSEAAAFLVHVCENGITSACSSAAVALDDAGRESEAAGPLTLGCDASDAKACLLLGVALCDQGAETRGRTALVNACALGAYMACDAGIESGCQDLAEPIWWQGPISTAHETVGAWLAVARNGDGWHHAVAAIVAFVFLLLVTLVRVFSTTFDTGPVVSLISPWTEAVAEDLPVTRQEEKILSEIGALIRPLSVGGDLAEVVLRQGGIVRKGALGMLRAREFARPFSSRWTWFALLAAIGLSSLQAVLWSGASAAAVVGVTISSLAGAIVAWIVLRWVGRGFLHWSRPMRDLLVAALVFLLFCVSFYVAVYGSASVWRLALLDPTGWLCLGVSLTIAVPLSCVLVKLCRATVQRAFWTALWYLRIYPRPPEASAEMPFMEPKPWGRNPHQAHLAYLLWSGRELSEGTWFAAILGRLVPESAWADNSGALAVRTALCRICNLRQEEIEPAMKTAISSAGCGADVRLLVRRMVASGVVGLDRVFRRWKAEDNREITSGYAFLPERLLQSFAMTAEVLGIWADVGGLFYWAAELFYIDGDEARTIAAEALSGGSDEREESSANDYEILGCAPTASHEEVRRCYRMLLAKYHPDKLDLDALPQDMAELAKARFNEIRAAYERIIAQRKGTS